MFKVNIIKNSTVTNSATFETVELATLWLQSESLNGSFGKIVREVRQISQANLEGVMEVYLENNEDISKSISQRSEIILDKEVVFHTLPADFTSEIVDITNQTLLAKESSDALNLLANSDYKVLRHLRQKALNIATTLTEEQYIQLEQFRHEASLKVI